MADVVRVSVIKIGCIGIAPLLDVLIDERADREDILVRGFTTGSKMNVDLCEAVTRDALAWDPSLVLVVSPNAALPGPARVREMLQEKNIIALSISDGPAKKAFYRKDEAGKKQVNVANNQGFLILPVDSMIGARREFLDPSEMIAFNSDILRVLSFTGYIRFVQNAIDKIISSLKADESPSLPTMIVTAEKAVNAAGFQNPYAHAKALAAIHAAQSVADLTTKGCFKVSEKERYIPLVAAGHELMRTAARLADEAREIEKTNNSVLRTAHVRDGSVQERQSL